MPRWPRGLHFQSGAQVSRAGMVQPRVRAIPQHHYWRQVEVPLFASARWNFNLPIVGLFPTTPLTAATGPQGTGESWRVDLVQVQADSQFGTPPLVAQQINAQVQGTTTTPPPPVIAQVWLQVGGLNLHLLGQSTTGGNDGIDVGGVLVTPGEQIAVVWYNVVPQFLAHQILGLWFVARGTKTVLVAEG